jgi:hypothetical protein
VYVHVQLCVQYTGMYVCTLYVVRRGSERECGGEVGQRAVRVRGVEGWTTDPKAAGPSVDF